MFKNLAVFLLVVLIVICIVLYVFNPEGCKKTVKVSIERIKRIIEKGKEESK